MDLFDILDIFLEPALDLVLCRGNFGVWFKKWCVSFLLAAGNIICLLRLISAICAVSVLGIVVWAIGTVLCAVLDWRYALWWYRDGRFGAELPWFDEIRLPRADLMNTPPEEAPFRPQPEEDIWKKAWRQRVTRAMQGVTNSHIHHPGRISSSRLFCILGMDFLPCLMDNKR